MTPEPTPTPAPSTPDAAAAAPTPPPQWQPLPEVKGPEPGSALPLDEWTSRATARRGQPIAQGLGWAVAIVGMLTLVIAYYQGYRSGVLPAPAGVRLDYIGAALAVVGVALAVTFAFVPSAASTGITLDATDEALRARAGRAHQRLRTAQILVGVSLGLVFIGLLWLLYWVRIGFLERALRQSAVGSYAVPTHYVGAILTLVGVVLLSAFWARLGPARAERAYAVVALKRTAAPGGGPTGAAASVTDPELQALMRRLDGLMAQLPDATVTEFSKTPEADTYLKLLGS